MLARRLEPLFPRPLFQPWLAILAAAIVLTLLVAFSTLPDEAGVIRDVQDWAFPGDTVSDAVRDLTTTSFVVVLGVLVAIVHQVEGDRRTAMVLVVLLVALVAAQAGLKELVDRPRPSEVATGIEVRASQTSPSFPAGHVMGPTVVYGWTIAMLMRPKRDSRLRRSGARLHNTLRWLLLIAMGAILLLTGLVNVYLGVHWPSDALGGYLWGLVLLLPALVYAAGREGS